MVSVIGALVTHFSNIPSMINPEEKEHPEEQSKSEKNGFGVWTCDICLH